MTAGLRALLTGILDYARLFPPAQLPLDQAIQAYAHYRRDPENWLLGRFICPVERLGDLTPFLGELFSSGPALAISALGRGGKTAAEFLAGVRADLDALAAFLERQDGRVDVAVYEVRLPSDVLGAGSKEAIRKLLHDAAGMIGDSKLPSLTVYYEAPLAADWPSAARVLSTALAEDHHAGSMQGRRSCQPAGFKLRCGGLDAAAFPSPEQVAIAILACHDSAVPLKFTAGLHHPIRHYSAEVQTHMHGFLNVFGAGVLAHTRQLKQDQVQRIIEDQDAEDFVFDDEGFRWKDHHASVAEIREARQSAVVSFGSCSFEEPRDDLRTLGLLG